MSNGNRSAVIIARVLGVDGYTDYVHNQVERYWKRTIQRRGSEQSIERLERRFSKFMAEFSEKDKQLVGRFISMRAKQNFDVGLHIGLVAFAQSVDKDITAELTRLHDRKRGRG